MIVLLQMGQTTLNQSQLICCKKNLYKLNVETNFGMSLVLPQKPANILVMGEGPERGRVKIGKYTVSF